MRNSIKKELLAHIEDYINEGILTEENAEEWHFYAFNEDHYIIGYYAASQWLSLHEIDAFDAISTCIEYEKENFGEVNGSYDNAESTVNMLVYIYGEELIYCKETLAMLEELRIKNRA